LTEVETLLFEAEVVPHRSLSTRGLSILLASMGVVSLTVTTLCWWVGAWPIAGFNGAEMLLAALLLRMHIRGLRAREVLLLTGQHFRVLRFDQDGNRTERQLPVAWLNVVVEERPGRVPGLFVVTHGRREELARALGENAKRDLAEALRGALHRLRHPVFENPQLA